MCIRAVVMTMNRRQSLAALVGVGTAAASSYVWMERRGLIRSDFVSEELTAEPRSAALGPAVRSILEFATLAPSGHNAQPWCVKASALAAGVDLRIGSDRSRWLAKVDPANRELALSIGAFLENLVWPPHPTATLQSIQ